MRYLGSPGKWQLQVQLFRSSWLVNSPEDLSYARAPSCRWKVRGDGCQLMFRYSGAAIYHNFIIILSHLLKGVQYTHCRGYLIVGGFFSRTWPFLFLPAVKMICVVVIRTYLEITSEILHCVSMRNFEGLGSHYHAVREGSLWDTDVLWKHWLCNRSKTGNARLHCGADLTFVIVEKNAKAIRLPITKCVGASKRIPNAVAMLPCQYYSRQRN